MSNKLTVEVVQLIPGEFDAIAYRNQYGERQAVARANGGQTPVQALEMLVTDTDNHEALNNWGKRAASARTVTR